MTERATASGDDWDAIIRKTCKEFDIEVIDMFVSPDHIRLFIQYPHKYSVSFIAKRLKDRSSRILRQDFPELKEWCKDIEFICHF